MIKEIVGTAKVLLTIDFYFRVLLDKPMTDEELTALVSGYPDPPAGYCLLVFQNDSESSQFLTIDVAAVNFKFDDASDETVGPRRIDLLTNQQAFFYTSRENGCVQRISWSFRSILNGERQIHTGALDPGDLSNGSRCWNGHIVHIEGASGGKLHVRAQAITEETRRNSLEKFLNPRKVYDKRRTERSARLNCS